jgi:long-subunit fatty acid transport protein
MHMEGIGRRVGVWGVTVVATLAICQSVVADGVILNGVSAVTIGRGGSNLAFTDNGSILHDNPASMAFLDGQSMLQVGVTALFTEFDYADADNDTRGQHQMYPLPEISYLRRLSDEWAVGAGIFSPAGFGSIFTLEGPAPFTGSQRYASFGSISKLLFGAAYAPSDYLSIGATIGPGLSFVDLEGPYTLQGPSGFAGLPTLLDLSVDGVGLVWSAGITLRLTETTTLGAAFQSESRIDASGTADAVTPVGSTTFQADADIAWPRSAGGGIRQQLGQRHVLAADVIWFDWSDAFDTFDLNLHSSTNPAFPDFLEQFPLRWRDTVSTRAGYEYHRDNGHIARVGYTHHKNPIPAGTISPFIPAALEHAFSLGYGWNWKGWQINGAYMFTFGPTVNTQTSDFIGGDFDNSTHRDRTHAASISFTRLIGGGACPAQCGSAVR